MAFRYWWDMGEKIASADSIWIGERGGLCAPSSRYSSGASGGSNFAYRADPVRSRAQVSPFVIERDFLQTKVSEKYFLLRNSKLQPSKHNFSWISKIIVSYYCYTKFERKLLRSPWAAWESRLRYVFKFSLQARADASIWRSCSWWLSPRNSRVTWKV